MTEQAFPNEGFNGWGEPQEGMTLRDYFAAKAMASIISLPSPPDWLEGRAECARWAYDMADSMLKVRQT